MDLEQNFKKHLDQDLSFLRGKKLLIAISGGLDSVVLTQLCYQLKLDIALAHCNFNLRSEESDSDEEFVLQLAEDLEIEVFIESFETEDYAGEHKLSIQMAARELRYNWFKELSDQLGFDYILTAHHADDNLETFFINLMRGTGLDGLLGIPKQQGKLVRPLLAFSREEIEAFAKQNNINWQEDSSNVSTKYLRNKLRHEVLPKLKEMNPQLLQNFCKTQEYLEGSSQIIDHAVKQVFKQVVDRENGESIYFNVEKIKNLPATKAYLYALLKDYSFTEWDDVYDLLSAQTGKFVQSSTHKLLKNRDQLILSACFESDFSGILIQEDVKEVKTPLGNLRFERAQELHESNNTTIYVDKDLLKFPLTVRYWENGDYFYPFGMQGKKKLSKYFKDEKLSAFEKEKALVLCSQEEIVWVMNKRADNRFKVSNATRTILKITLD